MLAAMIPLHEAAVRRLPLADGQDALRLAALAWPDNERAGQLAVIARHLVAGQADEFVLIEARSQSQLVGAILAQRLAGRTAVVWPPQTVGSDDSAGRDDGIGGELLDAVCEQLAQADIRLAQALVEAPTSAAAKQLIATGFIHAGDLLYMAAVAASFPSEPAASNLAFEPYSPASHERLVAIVEATYRGSLDCPLIDGLRETADVLDGYRAVGEFRPDSWLLVREQAGKHHIDIGCLLLADHPADNQVEIVYVGIVPQQRGRGFGLTLTRHAQWLAFQAGRSRLVLAVDAANGPAIAMYEAAGCVSWDRRSVLVRKLCRDASPC
jgi:mycothiol synthase